LIERLNDLTLDEIPATCACYSATAPLTYAIPSIGHVLDTQLQSHPQIGASNPRALKHHLHNTICHVELNVITSACTAGRI
jgi:hypothetical protein